MRSTVADFIVKYIDNQYLEVDGIEHKFVEGVFTIFGHGNVLGLGKSLECVDHKLNVLQGKNEQGMALSAMGFAKERNRTGIYAVTTSIGPGCTNLVTAAACATVNRIPMLLLPGDTFENGQPDPVLQQLENINSTSITATDCLRPVSKYYDRVSHPEKVFSILENSFSILTDPEKTGAVTISLPQDIQAQIIDFDESLIQKKIWKLKRRVPSSFDIDYILSDIQYHEKIVLLCGGGVKYSHAGKVLAELATKLNIPIVETQAGKSAVVNNQMVLGGIGVTGTYAANKVVEEASLIISFGSRLNDFTSQSSSFAVEKKLINVNLSNLDGIKQNGYHVDADIKLVIEGLLSKVTADLRKKNTDYCAVQKRWNEMLSEFSDKGNLLTNSEEHIEKFECVVPSALNQTQVVLKLNEILEKDAIVVTASGSLPGDLERLWTSKKEGSYHVEYGYSCMGYEINSAIGVKLASPQRPVYVFVGDGSFNMLHSEILTSLQYDIPINILLFDNSGFGCINNLQREYGSQGYRTEFKKMANELEKEFITCDYAKIAEGYGALSSKITNLNDLFEISNNNTTTLYDIKVNPKTMTDGFLSWWDVGFDYYTKNELETKKFNELQMEREKRNGTNIWNNK